MRKCVMLLLGVLLFSNLFAQTRTITGKVTEKNGTPIPNVSVVIKDGAGGTVTDASGNFSLPVPNNAQALTFSFVGYATQEVGIGGRTTINVTLSAAENQGGLQEVVVTGYSTRRRTEFTGAASKVGSKQIAQIPIGSFDQILQGRAPGLYIASGSGQPGAAARVNIRGVGSISGNTDPLYVVDGIPVEPQVFRTLNPNDFETVDVLKDAAGAGQYGSRGANGVIVITTKKGRAGKAQIQYRGQTGFSNPPNNTFNMMTTAQRLEFEEKILGPGGFGTGFPGWQYSPNNPRYQTLTPAQRATEAALLDSIRQINTDWQDIFFQRGIFQTHEVNASGGANNMNYYTSLSYYKQQGVVIRSDLERYTFRSNIGFRTDRLNVQLNAGAGFSKQSGIESEAGVALANPIAAAFLTLPYERLRLADGRTNVAAGKIGPNAYDRLFTTTNMINQFKGTLGITASLDIWGGIGLRTITGIDYRNNNTTRFIDPTSFAGRQIAQGQAGAYTEGNSENFQFITTSGLTFNRTFNSRHVVNAQAMFEFITNRARSNSATGFGLNPRLPNTPAAVTAGSSTNNLIPLFSGGRTRNALYSLFALADYTFDRKYTISASIRNDNPSQVPETQRSNYFYSVGASWNAIEENFMKNQNIFQELRIRASYGTAANVNGFTSDFGYIASYGSGSYSGTPGIVPNSPGNLDYALESQAIANIGLEFANFNRRLRTTLEFYNKESRDLFVNQQITRISGFTSLSTNAAEVRNRGIEIGIAGDVISKQDLTVTLGVNAGYNKNEITSLGSLTEFPSGTGIFRVGLPIGSHYTVGFVRVDPQTGNPIYLDLQGRETTVYSANNNLADFGTWLPTWTGGSSLDARWKGFDLSALFSFATGTKRFNNERFFYEGGNNLFQYNQRVEMLDAWTRPGQVTDYQRVGAGSTRQFSSKDINDASFLRFRNLQVGYTFNFRNPKYIRGFRLFAQGQNLATWTKWEGFDPEESNNIATYEFPNPKTFTFGVDINF